MASADQIQPEMQTGMQLRRRQLAGAVPVVRRQQPQPEYINPASAFPTHPTSPRPGVFGTVRKALTGIFSFMSRSEDANETSREEVDMEETIPYGSEYIQVNNPPAGDVTVNMSNVSQPAGLFPPEPTHGPPYTTDSQTQGAHTHSPVTSPVTQQSQWPPGGHTSPGTWLQHSPQGLPPQAHSTGLPVNPTHHSDHVTPPVQTPPMFGNSPVVPPVGSSVQQSQMPSVNHTPPYPPPYPPTPPGDMGVSQGYTPGPMHFSVPPPSGSLTPVQGASAIIGPPQYHNCTIYQGGNANRQDRSGKRIPEYNGDGNFEGFLANFYQLTRGWTDDERMLALRERLRGRAAKVLEGLDIQYSNSGTLVTLPILIAKLRDTFVGDQTEWLARLRDIRRTDGESLDELANRVVIYNQRAYGVADPAKLGVQFYLALRETPIGEKLALYQKESLDSLLEKAKTFESHLLANNMSVTNQSHPVAVAAMSEEATLHYTDTDQGANSQRGRGGYRGGYYRGRRGGQRGRGGRYSDNDRRFENVVCHVCGQKGHIWSRCEEAKKKLFPGGVPGGTSPTGDVDNQGNE